MNIETMTGSVQFTEGSVNVNDKNRNDFKIFMKTDRNPFQSNNPTFSEIEYMLKKAIQKGLADIVFDKSHFENTASMKLKNLLETFVYLQENKIYFEKESN